MEIYRTKTFLKAVKKLGATKEELEAVETEIADDHTTGDVISGTGGARKIRFAMGGKGKSGGGRAIYVAMVEDDVAYMLMATPRQIRKTSRPRTRKPSRPSWTVCRRAL